MKSDEFRVATPDETTGKETEFSLVVSLEIKKVLKPVKLSDRRSK